MTVVSNLSGAIFKGGVSVSRTVDEFSYDVNAFGSLTRSTTVYKYGYKPSLKEKPLGPMKSRARWDTLVEGDSVFLVVDNTVERSVSVLVDGDLRTVGLNGRSDFLVVEFPGGTVISAPAKG